MLPKEMIKEFIGKVCNIVQFENSFGFNARIIEIEDNWIKIKDENGTSIINSDMIKSIRIMPEKYQNKYR